jgi:hypothetical protein
MLTAFLEAFETALITAETADVHQKSARKVVGQIDALFANVEGLPEALRPTLPTEAEVNALRAITSAVITPELSELNSKVKSALSLVDTGIVEISDEDSLMASTLTERYAKLATANGTRKGSSGERVASGLRSLSHRMAVEIGGDVKLSGRDSGRGDWTWCRWQITDDAKSHDGVAKEQLDAIRTEVAAVEAGTSTGFRTSIEAGDGTEYVVSYPAGFEG